MISSTFSAKGHTSSPNWMFFFRGGNLYIFEFVFLLVLAFAFVAEEAVRVDDDAGVFAGRPGAGAGGGHSRLSQDHRTTGAHLMFGIVSGLV